MRVLFDHSTPFALAHGGFQVQIEQTANALRSVGLEVEYLRWWDDKQKGDIIHFFGRPADNYVTMAQQKGVRVVVSELVTGLGSRGTFHRALQRVAIRLAQTALPGDFTLRMGWKVFQKADCIVALTAWEAQLMREMFDAPTERIRVVANGVEPEFFDSPPCERGKWLVCTATVTERKRVLELAQAAVQAEVPLWIIGKPYSTADAYGKRFEEFARRNPNWIRYEGAIADRAKLAQVYRAARGFVLLSTMESLSLSALEAAACEAPLLLSDLPWARTVFKERASYGRVGSLQSQIEALRRFYDKAPTHVRPIKPQTWRDIAGELAAIYEAVLKS